MTVDIIKDVSSFSIRWTDEQGQRWTVEKSFPLTTRVLREASIEASEKAHFKNVREARQRERELRHAATLAEQMDFFFIVPEDFDRVVVDDLSSPGPRAAYFSLRADGRIGISKAAE